MLTGEADAVLLTGQIIKVGLSRASVKMEPLEGSDFPDPVTVLLFTIQEDDASRLGAYGIFSKTDVEFPFQNPYQKKCMIIFPVNAIGKSTGIQAAKMYIIKIFSGEIRG